MIQNDRPGPFFHPKPTAEQFASVNFDFWPKVYIFEKAKFLYIFEKKLRDNGTNG